MYDIWILMQINTHMYNLAASYPNHNMKTILQYHIDELKKTVTFKLPLL